ncbi:MAG: cohesin domain-containing protein, partial [Ardenticatenaceae bacterium]
GSGSLYIGSPKQAPDGRLTLPIISKLDSQLGAATIDVHYDPSQLIPTSCTAAPTGTFDLSHCNPEFDPSAGGCRACRGTGTTTGTVRLTAISATGATAHSGELLLAELTFDPVGDKPITPIEELLTLSTPTLIDPAGQPIDITAQEEHTRHTIYLPVIQK